MTDHKLEPTPAVEIIADADDKQQKKEKIVIRLSASKLDNFQKCKRYFQYTDVLNFEPLQKPEYRDKGSFGHSVLERYYRSQIEGRDKDRSFNDAIELGKDEATKLDLEISTTNYILDVFRSYHLRYSNDSWIPIFVEAPFSKVFYEDENFIVLFEGKVDLGVVNRGQENKIILVDHKTGEQNSPAIPLSNQFEGYCITFDTREIIRNFFGFQKDPSLRFSRSLLSYTDSVLEESKAEIIDWAFDIYEAISTETFPASKQACFRCHFVDVCKFPSELREFKLKAGYKKRDKYDLFSQQPDASK